MADDHDHAEDYNNLDPDDYLDLTQLSPEEREEWEQRQTEKRETKAYQEIEDGANRALDRWHQAQPVDVRTAVVDKFVETGEIDHVAAGVDQLEAQIVETAFAHHIERNILSHYGLTMEQFSEHIADADFAYFRKAAIEGRWDVFHVHAKAGAELRHKLGM